MVVLAVHEQCTYKLYLRNMRIRNTFLILACIVLYQQAGPAQWPTNSNSAEIYAQLKKLHVLGSVLYIAAHPDDENNGLLPYLAKEKMYRTGYLSLTRGDGGQNLIGSEQGIDLGLIRTQELLAARRVDGAEQYFSRAYEFGFSKSADEALRIWDHNKILSDVVWVIRQYQPDIIIKRFPPDARAGHGHHAASAIIADEAYVAAADPTRFPEQFAHGLKPWQAKRIMWNTFNFGGNNTTSNDQFKMEVGEYNPLIGKSYGELGGEARSMHKSQGEGRPRRRGEIYEFFATTAGEAPKNDLMDGIVTNWARIQGSDNIQPALNTMIANFNFDKPSASVTALIAFYRQIAALPASNWRNKKLEETQQVIMACTGLFAEAVTSEEYAVQGDTLRVSFNLNNRSGVPVNVKKITLRSSHPGAAATQSLASNNAAYATFNSTTGKALLDSTVEFSLAGNKNVSIDHYLKIDDNALLSQPYWLANGIKEGYFDVKEPFLTGLAENKANFVAQFTIEIAGQSFVEQTPVQYKYVDLVRGELYQPLAVIPKITVSISPNIVLNNVQPATQQMVRVNYTSNINAAKVPVMLSLQNGKATEVMKDVLVDFKKGGSGSFPVQVQSIYHKGQHNFVEPILTLTLNGKAEKFSQNMNVIRYEHIPNLTYFYRDNLKVIDTEIKVAGRKVGYISGAGDKVPDALLALGYQVTYLGEFDINPERLRQFDAVVVGIRAYNIYEYLSNKTDALNRYVENGGNLIVQYMKSNQVGLKRIKAGPFPFSVSNTRVTEEDAKVTIAKPQHPVFNFPNKITEKDFEGWVQERSTYQADNVDERYETLLEMKDTNDKTNSKGSLVIAKHGKGNFAYVSLVLFRQLPAGVPGAYRLLANLVALPQNKIGTGKQGK